MRGSHVLLVALAAAVTLTSAAAGGPTATKQRVNERYPDVTFPAWSPDGQKIAFLSWRPTGRSVFEMRVVNADGSGQRGRVLARKAGSFAWSSDGRRIAFEGPSTLDIYVVNADGSGQRRLTRDGAPSVSPVWSPDGRRIAFENWGGPEGGIHVVGADGSGRRTLTRRGQQPAWSPDGRKIAFVRSGDIYVMNSDGSEPQSLTRNEASDSDAAWSPDGRMIAFVSGGDPSSALTPNQHVLTMNADGSGKRKLARGFGPVWSPDGGKIAYVSERAGSMDVGVMNTDGSGQRTLTRSTLTRSRAVAFIPQPAWSPDGRKILFVSDRDGLEAVYVMNADGSRQRRLTSPGPAIPFAVKCAFSHRNQDDPIVYPGEPGRSHDHTFFGNRLTNALSSPAYLRAKGETTCANRADTSAYWVPTLYVAGRAVEPLALFAAYSRRTSRALEPFPAGLKMVAGTAHARRAQSSRVTFWSCAVPRAERSSTIPRCPGTRRGGLRLHVSFPDCWDGRRLDSADHKSHMAYSSHAACPRSHTVAVPALSLVVHYPLSGRQDAELASGGQFSGHADFLNAWNQAELASRVKRYLNRTGE